MFSVETSLQPKHVVWIPKGTFYYLHVSYILTFIRTTVVKSKEIVAASDSDDEDIDVSEVRTVPSRCVI